MKTMFEKPRFWIAFSIISAILFAFAWHFFPKALPIMQLTITMDREQAITDARNLAQQHGWEPNDPQVSATFDADTTTKTFVELAGGGQQAFTQMIHNEWYMPYQWHARLFKEYVTQETHVYFTPTGVPYGFEYKIAEDDELPSVTDQQARTLAEETAQQTWHIDLTPYTLFETANKRQPNGRVDHTFVYQRTDRDLKDGKYRLKIVVSGDKVTEINHYVHVPQEFILKYLEMRSANESIARAAGVFAYLFYLLLGAIIALFLLIRTGWVIWRAPIIWAAIVSLLAFLTELNNLPLNWMYYYTEHPMQSFLLNLLIQAIYNLFINFVMIALIFIAAESLTRKAFGGPAQLWRSWDKGIANSYTILGYTIGGYLQVAIDLAFVVVFYYIATNYLGWWSPISHLANPNILAGYLPWLSPVARALNAAFVEECEFRAIPLAGAALIGTWLGHRRAWIIGACIVQALVFSGAHANYTSVPAYARLVELIIPSLIYAGIYLRFGLLPTVICHYVYDVILMSLPLFVASTPFAWINKLMICICALLPLLVVLYRHFQASAWQDLSYDAYNHAWQPQVQNTASAHAPTSMLVLPSNQKREGFCLLLIALSIGVWLFYTKFTPDAPPLGIGRTQAIELARTALSSSYPELAEELATLYPVSRFEKKYQGFGDSRDILQHKYIWQTYGKDMYHKLMGSFLYPPMWQVRFLQFNGDVIERAYHVGALVGATSLDTQPTYAALNATYSFPDQVPGNSLPEKDARIIADRALVDKGVDLTKTTLVSAIANKHPERQDWTFTYAHTQVLPHEQARTVVIVEGDAVHHSDNEIHVPESWQREQTKHEGTGNALMTLMHILLRMLFIGGTIYALLQWAYRRISGRIFFTKFIGFLVISILTTVNDLAQMVAQFNTQEPFANQVFQHLSFNLQLLLRCGIFAFVATYLMSYRPAYRYKSPMSRLLAGITSGSIIVAVTALLGYFKPSLEPTWPIYTALAGWSPMLAFILSHTLEFLIISMTYALVYIIITYIHNRNPKLQPLAIIICILGGLCRYAMQPIDSIPYWLMAGTIVGITFYVLWFFFMRYAYSSIIFTGAVQMTFAILLQMWYAPFNNVIPAGIITIILIMGIASVWLREYEQNIKRETVNFNL